MCENNTSDPRERTKAPHRDERNEERLDWVSVQPVGNPARQEQPEVIHLRLHHKIQEHGDQGPALLEGTKGDKGPRPPEEVLTHQTPPTILGVARRTVTPTMNQKGR